MADVCIQRATYTDLQVAELLAPLGGMAHFVNRGENVLLKVNLLSGRVPEKGVTTHPAVVRAVAREVRRAGGNPYIGDSPSGRFSQRALKKAYRKSGLAEMAREEDIDLNWNTGSRRMQFPGGVKLKRFAVCDFVAGADKVIALAKLKTHSFQYLTLACKIMYGAIPGLTKARYHARFPRRAAFADMLLDVTMLLKPDLVIMDGILGMQGQGPGNGDPVRLDRLLAAPDPVAMDIAVCRLLGIEPMAIPVLKRAKVRKLWPASLEYPLLAPGDAAYRGFRLPNTTDHLLTGKKAAAKRPFVTERCTACGDCAEICPKGAMAIRDSRAVVEIARCIRCYCCHEVCPEDAIRLIPVGKR